MNALSKAALMGAAIFFHAVEALFKVQALRGTTFMRGVCCDQPTIDSWPLASRS